MRRVPRSSDPFKTIERQAAQVVARLAPDVREAAALTVRGENASDLFDRIRKETARAQVVAGLLGHAAQYRSLRAQGLVDRASDDGPVEAPVRIAQNSEGVNLDPFSIPFVEALNLFRGEVPDLQTVVDGLIQSAESRLRDAAADPELRMASIVTRAREAAERRLMVGGEVVDPSVILRATARVAGSLAERELDTNTRTTVMQGYNGGAAERIQRSASVVPVMELSEIQDRRTRGNANGEYPEAGPHYQMDGFAAATDDPIWRSILPPNGWNCRASVRGVSVAECRRRRWLVDSPFGETVDRVRLRAQFSRQWGFIERGEYPDAGFGVAA